MNKLRNTNDMESYEEKYKQAIEAAKRELHYCGSLDCDAARQIFRLFPELKESEDEKIIRTLKEIVNWGCAKNISVDNNVELKDCLAWLEKQGEQENLCDKCRKEQPSHSCQDITALGRCALEKQGEQKHINECNMHELTSDEARKWNDAYEKGYSLGYENGRNEQKPIEWSEEDEKILNTLMKIIGEFSREKNHHWFFDEVDSKTITDWLKSLKPQNRWKPSKDQMFALSMHIQENPNLESLYNDLKKL